MLRLAAALCLTMLLTTVVGAEPATRSAPSDTYQGRTAAQWLAIFENANQSNNSEMRAQSLQALKAIGAPAATLIARRFTALATIDDCFQLLVEHAATVLPIVIDLPEIKDEALNQKLTELLWRSKNVESLRRKLTDPEPFIRARTAAALAAMAQIQDLRPLVQPLLDDALAAAADTDARVRAAAMWMLARGGFMADERRAPVFAAALSDSDPRVRIAAAYGLQSVAPAQLKPLLPQIIKAIETRLDSHQPADLSGEAMTTILHRIGRMKADGAEAVGLLARLAKADTGPGHLAAVHTLEAIGKPAIPAMIELHATGGKFDKILLVKWLTELNQQAASALPTLIQFLDDPDEEVKGWAAQAIAAVAPASDEAAAALQRLARQEPKFADTVKMLLDRMDQTEPADDVVIWTPATAPATQPAPRDQAQVDRLAAILKSIESLCTPPIQNQDYIESMGRLATAYARLEMLDDVFRIAATASKQTNVVNPDNWYGQKVALLGSASAAAWRRGDQTKSQKLLAEAIELGDKYSGAMYSNTWPNLALEQFQAGNLSGVAKIVTPPKPNQPQRWEALLAVAHAMLDRGDISGAHKAAAAIGDKEARMRLQLRIAAEQEADKDPVGACATYDAALRAARFGPTMSDDLLTRAGRGRARTGDAAGAIRPITRVKRSNTLFAMRVLVGDLLARRQTEDAFEAAKTILDLPITRDWILRFAALIEVGPHKPEAFDLAVQVVLKESRQGNVQEQEPTPDSAIEALRRIAATQFDAGRVDGARATLLKAIDLSKQHRDRLGSRKPWSVLVPLTAEAAKIDPQAVESIVGLTNDSGTRALIRVGVAAALARRGDLPGAAAAHDAAKALLPQVTDNMARQQIEPLLKDVEQYWLANAPDRAARSQSFFNPDRQRFNDLLTVQNWAGAMELAKAQDSPNTRDPQYADIAMAAIRCNEPAAAFAAATLVSDPRHLRPTDRGQPAFGAIAELAASASKLDLANEAMARVQGDMRVPTMLSVASELAGRNPSFAAATLDKAVQEITTIAPGDPRSDELLLRTAEVELLLHDPARLRRIVLQVSSRAKADPQMLPRLARVRVLIGDGYNALSEANAIADRQLQRRCLLNIAEAEITMNAER